MDPLERVMLIGKAVAISLWGEDEFRAAATQGKRRWQEIEDLFGITYGMFQDALSQIAPSFRLTPREKSLAEAVEVWGNGFGGSRLAVCFVKWERCPETSGQPNPYEPWIEIWEHGGSFSGEHARFVDVYDHSGMGVGHVTVRHY